jgi:hypothetical protein
VRESAHGAGTEGLIASDDAQQRAVLDER